MNGPASSWPAREQRFLGIDLLRILAVYGVVVLHSGINRDYLVTPAAAAYQNLFEFAVPSFLAISFFLQAFRAGPRPFDIRARWRRIMIPYFIWTLIHIAARCAKYTLLHQRGALDAISSDPMALLFFGAASVQLYFLPLLFAGSCLCALLIPPSRKTPTPLLILLLLLAGWLLYRMDVTGNGFDLARGAAFQSLAPSMPVNNPPLRFALVLLAWLTRCLPYVIGALLLTRIKGFTAPRSSTGWLVLWSLLFVASVCLPLPPGVGELIAGISSLATALALSCHLRPNPILTALASFTFGIFLIHDLVLEMLDLVFKRMRLTEISLLRLAAISLAVYVISALLVWLGSRLGKTARIILAVG